jgi:hypothetical protein
MKGFLYLSNCYLHYLNHLYLLVVVVGYILKFPSSLPAKELVLFLFEHDLQFDD